MQNDHKHKRTTKTPKNNYKEIQIDHKASDPKRDVNEMKEMKNNPQ